VYGFERGQVIMPLIIRLFGQISVDRAGESLSGLSAKAMELLCFLLLHRERAHARETLAVQLWPDTSESLARKYLRQAIWRLQSALVSSQLLTVHPGWIRINPKALLWLDIAEFEEMHDIHRNIPGQQLTDGEAQALEKAVGLYRGDLIETWYQDWCLYERDRFQLVYIAMLEQLMVHCEARCSYTQGVAYGQRVLRLDPARECTHRILMRLYYKAGDRTTALRQYERCASAMAKQFGIHPSRETIALYHHVRSDRVGTHPAQPADITHGVTGLLTGLQVSLDDIQASLSALQQHVQQLPPVSRIHAG
jgi:DNA-binding SARP family transcriptional activator